MDGRGEEMVDIMYYTKGSGGTKTISRNKVDGMSICEDDSSDAAA